MVSPCETLTVEEILDINRRLIEEHGGAGVGFQNRGSLEFALEEIHGSLFGKEMCPTIFDKASTLGWRIIKDHVFLDGNKRTGMVCSLIFLDINGCEFDAPSDEMVAFAVKIAEGQAKIRDFASFLRKYSA
jgi:death-on-curing protein